MMLNQEQTRKRRRVDNSVAEARRAIGPTLLLFGPWRAELAKMQAARGRAVDGEAAAMNTRCAIIRADVQRARQGLQQRLGEVSLRAAGNSRVEDALRALDQLESVLDDFDDRLGL